MGIHILDENTINKIAAGEVVENPASVVKELAENAIDAGASSVTIEIENGGIKKIRVTDNGCGIKSGEAALAFMRHATSKITDIKDLINISSLGFRGEALSSIASVSMVEMATKTRDGDMGAELIINGGKQESIKAAGLPNGTTVIVKNLFFNTPARFKFLKSVRQETAAVTDYVSKLILSHPEISFKYINNNEKIYISPGNGNIKDVMICVYGKDIVQRTAKLDYEYGGAHVYGYIGLPQFAAKNRRSQSFFVNGRYIKWQNLSYYIQNAYSQRLLKGHYPFVLLYMDMAYNLTDVNVHPNKLAIRFKDEKKIEYIIGEAVNNALMNKPLTGFINIKDEPEIKKEEKSGGASKKPDAANGVDALGIDFSGFKREKHTLNSDSGMFYEVVKSLENKKTEKEEEIPAMPELDAEYKIIGQAFSSYILIEHADTLFLIDQHAAHERLLYEKAVKAFMGGETLSIPLLLPEVINVSPDEKALVDENMGVFSKIGFDMADFGPLSYRITAVPYLFNQTDIEGIFDDMIGELKNKKSEKPLIRAQNMIKASCKKAVKANMPLSEKEMFALVKEFVESSVMPACPHGRPIITAVKKSEIEKGFKRRV